MKEEMERLVEADIPLTKESWKTERAVELFKNQAMFDKERLFRYRRSSRVNIYNLDARGMEKIRDYILDNKHYAKEIIEKFNKAGLLEVRGEKYKRAYYPDENAVLQEWLERKRISFVHEDELSIVFYGRDMLNCILNAFDSVQDVYFMLKEALQMTNA